jgi:putative phage-type endonuclease
MLTASDVAAALGVNPYESRTDLLYKKCGFKRPQSTIWTDYGTRLESEARDKYCAVTGETVFEIGLQAHRDYPWLGGSPDGITDSGKLIEIKCPPKREITSTVPKYYVPQVQILMEIFELEECDFIQYKPNEKFEITRVTRDRKWFHESLPILEQFWNDVTERRKLPLWEGGAE